MASLDAAQAAQLVISTATNRDQNHHPAHCRRAFFLQMRFGAVAADRLTAALLALQPADNRGAEDKTDQQRRRHRAAGSESDIAEQVEQNELVRQGPEDHVKHQVAPAVTVEQAKQNEVIFAANSAAGYAAMLPWALDRMVDDPGDGPLIHA